MIARPLQMLAMAFLLAVHACAQTPAPTPPNSAADTDRWSFSLTTYGYLVPHDTSYASPIFTADRKWLHLEARYNYENQETGSVWTGYNLSLGHKLVLEITPMLGAVFGRTAGIAPGCNLALRYERVELSSQCEYVFDIKEKSGSFFYSWNELTYSFADWFRAGLVAQRTRAYHTPLDVQRGFLAGFSHNRFEFTTYVLNAGWTDPTVILTLGVKF